EGILQPIRSGLCIVTHCLPYTEPIRKTAISSNLYVFSIRLLMGKRAGKDFYPEVSLNYKDYDEKLYKKCRWTIVKTIELTYPHIPEKETLPETVAAIGLFYGIHKGHQRVIKTAVDEARECGVERAVCTVNPH